jgi:hypothetical protein
LTSAVICSRAFLYSSVRKTAWVLMDLGFDDFAGRGQQLVDVGGTSGGLRVVDAAPEREIAFDVDGSELELARLLGEAETDLLGFVLRKFVLAGNVIFVGGAELLVVGIGLDGDLGGPELGDDSGKFGELLLALGRADIIDLHAVHVTTGIGHVIGAEDEHLRLVGTGVLREVRQGEGKEREQEFAQAS